MMILPQEPKFGDVHNCRNLEEKWHMEVGKKMVKGVGSSGKMESVES